MREPAAKTTEAYDTRGDLWRWVGLLLAPLAWSVHVEALLLTSDYGCTHSDLKWNHVASAICLAIAIAGGVIAWMYWPAGEYEESKEAAWPIVRRRFMGILGVVLAVLFSTLIAAQWLPTLLGVPCDK